MEFLSFIIYLLLKSYKTYQLYHFLSKIFEEKMFQYHQTKMFQYPQSIYYYNYSTSSIFFSLLYLLPIFWNQKRSWRFLSQDHKVYVQDSTLWNLHTTLKHRVCSREDSLLSFAFKCFYYGLSGSIWLENNFLKLAPTLRHSPFNKYYQLLQNIMY